MAKRRPTGNDNRQSLDKNAFFIDDAARTADRAVHDEITHNKLDQVIAGVGGSTDTTPIIYNLNIINQGTEYTQILPSNTKSFIIRSRDKGRLRLAYSLGGTTTDYLTIPTGSSFKDTNFYTSITVYIQSTKPGDIVEIVAYS